MSKVVRRFDPMSAPVLYGGMYFLLFGLGPIDVAFFRGVDTYRVGRLFLNFHGISFAALAYVWLGYALFVLGYYLPVGRIVGSVFSTSRLSFSSWRTSIVTAVLFSIAYLVVVLYAQQYGYVRRAITEESDPASFLLIVGDLSLIAFSMGVWHFMLSRRPNGPRMSRKTILFVWGVMLPLQMHLYIWGGTRIRVAFMLLIIMLAYHYGYRRLSGRFLIIGAFIIFGIVMPVIAFVRAPAGNKPALDSVSSGFTWVWDSVMQRTSGLEGFTVMWENLDRVPEPDPLWMIVASVVPRVIWPNKPFSTWSERFSTWASNIPSAQLTPTLTGELLLHFGHVGGLLAMLALGILWRIARSALIGFRPHPFASGFIYICLLTFSLQAIEGGFVIEYGALLRFLVVGLLLLWIVSTRRPQSVRVINTRKQSAMPS